MNVETLITDRKAALELWKRYQSHKNNLNHVDLEIARIAKMVATGKGPLIPALAEIVKAGVNEAGQPKLAIMRADQKLCYLDMMSDGRAIMHNRGRDSWNLHRAAASLKFEFPAGSFPAEATGIDRAAHPARYPA